MITIEKPVILFTLIHKEEEHRVLTHANEFHSRMSLISDHLAIPGFGLCSGMGSCGTCTIDIYRKEVSAKISRFSCEIPVNDNLTNTTIII